MRPLMYKQRPSYPALIAASSVLIVGASLVWHYKLQVEDGLAEPSQMIAAGCFSCGIAGALLVFAFARYQFTHLWKKPDPAFDKKKKKNQHAAPQSGAGSSAQSNRRR